MDGNRRWARQAGFDNPSIGHRYGAEHLEDLLHWCQRVDIHHVTVFVCSTENLTHRAAGEVAFLMNVIETTISRLLTRPGRSWRVHVAGNPDVLPDSTATALKDLCNQTEAVNTGRHLSLAVGYGGRQEILDAFTGYLHEQAATDNSLADLAGTFEPDDIDRHLYQPQLPLPEIIIRTSGEQRSSNFLIWQGAHANERAASAMLAASMPAHARSSGPVPEPGMPSTARCRTRAALSPERDRLAMTAAPSPPSG